VASLPFSSARFHRNRQSRNIRQGRLAFKLHPQINRPGRGSLEDIIHRLARQIDIESLDKCIRTAGQIESMVAGLPECPLLDAQTAAVPTVPAIPFPDESEAVEPEVSLNCQKTTFFEMDRLTALVSLGPVALVTVQ
jgi:hypothetical protein